MTLADQAEAMSDLRPFGSHPDHDDPAVLSVPRPLDETVLLQQPYLSTRCGRVHVGQSGELANRQVSLLLEPAQEGETRLGDDDSGGCRSLCVHLAARVQAQQLLDRPLHDVQVRGGPLVAGLRRGA